MFSGSDVERVGGTVAHDKPYDGLAAVGVVSFGKRADFGCDGIAFVVDGDEIEFFAAFCRGDVGVTVEVDEAQAGGDGNGERAPFGLRVGGDVVLEKVSEGERAEIRRRAVLDDDVDGGGRGGIVAVGEEEVRVADDASPVRGGVIFIFP